MNANAVVLPAGGLQVPVGAVVAMNDGKKFIVVTKTKSSVTLVPLRWWHSVPWWFPLSIVLIAGFVLSEFLWHWWI